MSKNIEQHVEQWVEDMDTKALFTWAEVFGVAHDRESWLDDEYPPKVNELRVKLVETILAFRRRPGHDLSEFYPEPCTESKPPLMEFIERFRWFLPPKEVLVKHPNTLESLAHETCDRLESQAEQLAAKDKLLFAYESVRAPVNPLVAELAARDKRIAQLEAENEGLKSEADELHPCT